MGSSNTKARNLRDAVRRLMVVHGTLKQTRRPCGTPMSLPHTYALLELLHSKNALTVSDLAESMAIDRTNVSRLCARMEADGELVRQPHPEDGRARALRLTARGRKLARGVDDSSARHFVAIAQELGSDTGRVIEALKLLERSMALTEEES